MSDQTLRYRAPDGQDRVTVMTALRDAGFDVAPDDTDPQVVVIPGGTDDRERARQAIGSVHTTAIDAGVPMDPGTIRFADES